MSTKQEIQVQLDQENAHLRQLQAQLSEALEKYSVESNRSPALEARIRAIQHAVSVSGTKLADLSFALATASS